MPRSPWARRRTAARGAARLDPAAAARPPAAPARPACGSRSAVVVLALLGGGGYYAIASRGPIPRWSRRAQAAEEAEAQAAQGRGGSAEAARRERAAPEGRAERRRSPSPASARRRPRRPPEAVRGGDAAQDRGRDRRARRRADEEAKRKADEEAEARRKAIDDARKAVEFVAGPFDHFGKTLMMIGLKDRPDEVRLQGVDIVERPGAAQARRRARWPPSRATCAAARPTA